jgi:methyltransferase-like protein/SAM-dependent methyltransferase
MTGNQYDVVPYDSHPFSRTHPENLFTIARLFGLSPPDYRSARILELGCGQGDNLIPIACNYPDCHCVGIDLSGRQIEPARREAAALDLDNLVYRQMSIADIDGTIGEFDYILCHGVYSWVPQAVRRKILSICRDQMSHDGVAYVSYNCRPGWNMIKSIRDMMRFHVADFDDPAEKADQARTMLRFILDSQGREDSAYAAYLQSELNLLSHHRDAYLLHDHLEEINHAPYFHEFIQQAETFGLAYLGETDLETMFPDNLSPQVAEKIREIRDIVKSEQYMDFIRNRRFRCTLLCHDRSKIRRDLHVSDIETFFIASQARPKEKPAEEHLADGIPVAFSDGSATAIIRGRIPKTAMVILSEQQNQPMAYRTLCDETMGRTGIADPRHVRDQINEDLNLLRLLFAGLIHIHSSAGPYTTRISDSPRASRLARHQAARGNVVTSQRHGPVVLNSAEQVLIRHLDGRSSLADLAAAICGHVDRGHLVLERDGGTIADADERIEAAEILCVAMLEGFAAKALLVETDRPHSAP